MTEEVRSTIQKRDDKGVVRHGGEWLAIWSDPDSLKPDHEKREEEAQRRALSAVETSLAATARSMAGRDIDVVFGGDHNAGGNRIVLPRLAPDAANLVALRGECDAKASFLAHHDPAIFREQTPEAPIEARLFKLLEELRCEALEARAYPGVARNLVALHLHRLERAQLLHAHLASLLPLSEALRMVCRDCFLNTGQPSIQTAGFRMWDRWLRDRFQPRLDDLTRRLAGQRAYAQAAQSFIDGLLTELPSAGERQRRALKNGIRRGRRNRPGGSGIRRPRRCAPVRARGTRGGS